MGRNAAVIAARQIEAQAQFVSGLTCSVPVYKVVDALGDQQWVVNVYIGPPAPNSTNIIYDVPIAPYALNLVANLNSPVMMQVSKQGLYTIIGAAQILPAGAQTPSGSILTPTYQEIQYNLAELRLTFIADIDYELEPWGEKHWAEPGLPWQQISASDAFGFQVMGPDLGPPSLLDPTAATITTTRHVQLTLRAWGPGGDPDALIWGTTPWGAPLVKTIELVN